MEKTVLLVTGEWEPYTSQKIDGNGFITEIVASAFKEMDVDYEIQFYHWEKCLEMVESGEAFGSFPFIYSENKAENFLFSNPIYNIQTRFFYYNRDINSNRKI